MKAIEVCPSTLRSGYETYSPQAVKELFDGKVVSPFIDIDFENDRDLRCVMENMNNMPDIEKSDAYDRTGHPCRLDFERFGDRIGLPDRRVAQVLDMFMQIPQEAYALIDRSFLNDKMKRAYKRVIVERLMRYVRKSE